MKIHIFGDSHIGVLSRGWKELNSSEIEIDFYGAHGVNWSNSQITETDSTIQLYQNAVQGSKPADYLILKNRDWYIVSTVLHSAPTYRHSAWKKYCPWQCAHNNPTLQAISSEIIEQWVLDQCAPRLDVLWLLKSRGLNVAVIEPPKPLRQACELSGIKSDVLEAVSQIHRNRIIKWLNNRNIPVIRTPESTYDAAGFTEKKFTPSDHKDPHHGNYLYGMESMKEIVKFFNNV